MLNISISIWSCKCTFLGKTFCFIRLKIMVATIQLDYLQKLTCLGVLSGIPCESVQTVCLSVGLLISKDGGRGGEG